MSINDNYSETNDKAVLTIGDKNRTGTLRIQNVSPDPRVQPRDSTALSFEGATGTLKVGDPQSSVSGTLDLYSIKLESRGARLSAGGGSGRGDGNIQLFSNFGVKTVDLSGRNGNLDLGGRGAEGELKLFNSQGGGTPTISFSADRANGIMGGQGANGRLDLHKADGVRTIRLRGEHGNIELGGQGADGDISVRNAANQETISINGDSGDIIFRNADFAEEFDLAESAIFDGAEPGSVMVMDDTGALTPCLSAYDTRVVGVIAGAEGYKPALVLDRQGGDNRRPIAMIGKVMCKVSCDAGPVKIGDLLTTSAHSGCAQVVVDRGRALGAVIGKAMGSLDEGRGLIPVLVNLQ